MNSITSTSLHITSIIYEVFFFFGGGVLKQIVQLTMHRWSEEVSSALLTLDCHRLQEILAP